MIGDPMFEGTNLLDFEVLANGDVLFVLDRAWTLPGIGAVTPRDVIRLHPTSTNPIHSGTFTFELKGAIVGLTTTDENIDALAMTPTGHLVISTIGSATINGVGTVKDEDLIEIQGTTGSLYFDGSKVNLTNSSEDIAAASIGDSALYLATKGNFTVSNNNTLSGVGSDIFSCAPTTSAPIQQCNFAKLFTGQANSFTSAIDGFSLAPTNAVAASASSADGQSFEHSAIGQIEPLPIDTAAFTEAMQRGDPELTVDDFINVTQQLYLPIVQR